MESKFCKEKKRILRGELALIIAVAINSFGVVLMLYSGSGISAISSVPFAFSEVLPQLSLGTWTYIFQGALVLSLMNQNSFQCDLSGCYSHDDHCFSWSFGWPWDRNYFGGIYHGKSCRNDRGLFRSACSVCLISDKESLFQDTSTGKKTLLKPEDLHGETLILGNCGLTGYADPIWNELKQNHPQIHLKGDL